MDKFVIHGKKLLSGEIRVSGAKNAILPALAAGLMIDGSAHFTNIPAIEDIHRMVELIHSLGASITFENNTVTIDASSINQTTLHPELHQKLRASIMLAGPMLHRMGSIDFPYPGGCIIGKRPIDFFLDGFKKFGVTIDEHANGYTLAVKKLQPATLVFPRVSVTGTEAMMTFAAKIPGVTKLLNCAMEPEVGSLAEWLNSCGAKITGAGTSTITIEGVDSLEAKPYTAIPDRIEAGTFALLGAATQSPIKVTGIDPSHLEVIWALLEKAGVEFVIGNDFVEIKPPFTLKALPKDLVTHEYPGLPTDLQAPFTVLMTQAQGNSLIFETIYEARLFYVDKLNSMGANILMCDPHRVMVMGPTKLSGKKISSPDIRAGMALVIAALISEGETVIDNIYQIDRGYERIEERLKALGADIKRIE
jgi:UDP-N-acetylglucosamine 1-carboxyvinyltransferase